MAKKVLTGNAVAVTDMWSYTFGTIANTTVHGITCNGKTITVTLGSGETNDTAAGKLVTALSNSTAGEFQEYTWGFVLGSGVVTGTAKVTGVAGVFTKASGAHASASMVNTTPASGPTFLNLAANWSGGTLPANGDDIYLTGSSPSVRAGLDWFRANSIVPASINLDDYGGSIGLPATRGGTAFGSQTGQPYTEYRKTHLELPAGSIVVNIGRGSTLPSRVNLDLAGTGTTVNVFGANPPQAGERASVYIRGTTGHPRLAVTQGAVAVAFGTGETGGFASVLIGDEGNPAQDAFVLFGEGATAPDVDNLGGRSESAVGITSLTMGLSASEHVQTAGNLTATIRGAGRLVYSSTGTLTVDAAGGGTIDFSKDPRPKTLHSSSKILERARLIDPGDTRATGSACLFDHTSLPVSQLGPAVTITK
jgi:hypothetical protein